MRSSSGTSLARRGRGQALAPVVNERTVDVDLPGSMVAACAPHMTLAPTRSRRGGIRDARRAARRPAGGLRGRLLEQRRPHRPPRRHQPLDDQPVAQPLRLALPGRSAVGRPGPQHRRAVARGRAPGRARRGVHGGGVDVLHLLAGLHVGGQHLDPHVHGPLRRGAPRLDLARRAGRAADLGDDERRPRGDGGDGVQLLRAAGPCSAICSPSSWRAASPSRPSWCAGTPTSR